jgi:hypothetical protein
MAPAADCTSLNVLSVVKGLVGHTRGRGPHITQEFQPLRRQLTTVKIDTRRVAARPSKASDKTKLDRVFGGDKIARGSAEALGCAARP